MWALPVSITQAVMGVPITVTRPAPDDTPIATRGIWRPAPLEDSRPYGTDFQRVGPRRVMAIGKADVDDLPRGSIIAAPEVIDGVTKNWRVDGFDPQVDPYQWRVILVSAP